jgi:hypothetical protein
MDPEPQQWVAGPAQGFTHHEALQQGAAAPQPEQRCWTGTSDQAQHNQMRKPQAAARSLRRQPQATNTGVISLIVHPAVPWPYRRRRRGLVVSDEEVNRLFPIGDEHQRVGTQLCLCETQQPSGTNRWR